jgi:ABC-type polysaccharide/polyol phosphate export permease
VVGSHLFVWIPFVLGMMILLALFSTGVAMMLSIANVYFRDTQHFVSILFQAWFYLTPILYPISLVAKQSVRMGPLFGDVTVLDLYQLNPMVQFIEIFRNLMYDNRMPAPGTVAACVVWTVIAVAIGSWVFEHNQAKLAEAL